MEKQLVCFLCAVAVLTPPICFSNIVVNGDFEDTSLLGWSVNSSWGLSAIPGGLYQCANPVSGQYQLCFGGGGAPAGGYIEQNISTVPGWTYNLSFFLGRGGTEGSLAIRADLFDISNTLLNSMTGYSPYGHSYGPRQELNFIATTTTTRLRFTDVLSAGIADALLDNVVIDVVSVPEPASLLLLGLGGLLIRRK
jgi:hypothetical protein